MSMFPCLKFLLSIISQQSDVKNCSYEDFLSLLKNTAKGENGPPAFRAKKNKKKCGRLLWGGSSEKQRNN
jgi:hypothetical protein